MKQGSNPQHTQHSDDCHPRSAASLTLTSTKGTWESRNHHSTTISHHLNTGATSDTPLPPLVPHRQNGGAPPASHTYTRPSGPGRDSELIDRSALKAPSQSAQRIAEVQPPSCAEWGGGKEVVEVWFVVQGHVVGLFCSFFLHLLFASVYHNSL